MNPVYKIGDSKVIESRESNDGMMIRRRRETLDGKFRFTTYERIERPAIIVLKQSGQKELFDRGKLLNAIRKSVGKFFESELEVEDVVSKVEDAVYMLGEEEIKSKVIGEKVLEVLAEANEVAYVRFASVFREFKSLGEFERILTEVQRKKGNSKTIPDKEGI
ncbi:MAG: transcriptional regulator NrdR [Candidatus Nomurabacteria bacterium]|jgi:transcriptional repressor NrdR|nr:transcriptional regulator NrdR [Candidatus Nomurabacteria bacterium]